MNVGLKVARGKRERDEVFDDLVEHMDRELDKYAEDYGNDILLTSTSGWKLHFYLYQYLKKEMCSLKPSGKNFCKGSRPVTLGELGQV